MNDKKREESADGNQVVPTNDGSSSTPIAEVRQIHQRGGYFVGISGWSGIAFWALGKVIGLFNYGAIWALILGLTWIAADEATRIWIRNILGEEPKTTISSSNGNQQFPLFETDDYHDLPILWKQFLAEVRVNQSKYPPRFVSLLRELTLKDISMLDHIAPYVIDNALIHVGDLELGYSIPFVTDLDLERLKTIGIITSPRFGGMSKDIAPKNGNPAQETLRGTTLALVVRATNATKTVTIDLTPLTEEGVRIINLLRKPTSLKALCMIAARMKKKKEINTFILATLAPESGGSGWSDRNAIVNVSQTCSQIGTDLVKDAGGE